MTTTEGLDEDVWRDLREWWMDSEPSFEACEGDTVMGPTMLEPPLVTMPDASKAVFDRMHWLLQQMVGAPAAEESGAVDAQDLCCCLAPCWLHTMSRSELPSSAVHLWCSW